MRKILTLICILFLPSVKILPYWKKICGENDFIDFIFTTALEVRRWKLKKSFITEVKVQTNLKAFLDQFNINLLYSSQMEFLIVLVFDGMDIHSFSDQAIIWPGKTTCLKNSSFFSLYTFLHMCFHSVLWP